MTGFAIRHTCFIIMCFIILYDGYIYCYDFKFLRYSSYGCNEASMLDIDAIQPLELVSTSTVRKPLECVKMCGQNAQADYPLFALVYNITANNDATYTCHLLTTMTLSFDAYTLSADLTDAALTPFCGLYFPQGQTCDTLQGEGQTLSWINLWPGHIGLPAICDFDTDSGGWTLVQRRQDGSENFYRTWEEYKAGFGSLHGEFWFGLEKMKVIVDSGPTEIRFDVETNSGAKRYAVYQDFWFADESELYEMTVGSYTGDAGDSFTFHNNSRFDTKDKLPRSDFQCPERFGGAFWFHNCHNINPNGVYGATGYGEGINWNLLTGYYESLTFIEMRLRLMS